MLSSIFRITLFIALVAALIFGINQLMHAPGGITITFAGREFYFTPLGFVALALAGFAALWVLLRLAGLLLALLRFIFGDETALSRFFDRSRERRGLEALARGMTALASGDAWKAKSKAEKAERLLQRPELTRLLNAQVADMTGDSERAKIYYKAMADDPQTAFVGLRGLLKQAIAENQTDKALKLAQAAAQIKPKDPGILETLYTLQSQKFDWAAARKTLAAQKRIGAIPKDEAARRDSMLALAQAEDAETLGESEHARKLAVEAAKIDPTNADAVAVAAGHLVTAGSKRAAARLIIDAWRRNPSPQLAAAYAAIEPDESPAARQRRFQRLIEANDSATESLFTRAELALVNEDWALARRTLERIEEDEPSARYCAIMAAIVRGEGGPEAEVRAWLARAVGAPRGEGESGAVIQAAMQPLLVEPVSGDAEDEEETAAGAASDKPAA